MPCSRCFVKCMQDATEERKREERKRKKEVKGGLEVTFYSSTVLRKSVLVFLWYKGDYFLHIFSPFLQYSVD